MHLNGNENKTKINNYNRNISRKKRGLIDNNCSHIKIIVIILRNNFDLFFPCGLCWF